MTLLRLLAPLLLALFATSLPPLAAQVVAQPPVQTAPDSPPAPPGAVLVRVALQTSEGAIILALDATHAPMTTANFLRYVDGKKLDGINFYRAVKFGPGEGLIQGGARGDPARLFPPIAHEPTSLTGISHVAGTLSMARYEPGSATSDFFITASAMPSLDENPSGTGDNAGFAAFGHVVEGMDVVQRILNAPTSPTEGEGVMKGQMLEPKILLLTARRVNERP
jgi:peptidyl-prolyl cis-trans isomerase A (cyclophilin A)